MALKFADTSTVTFLEDGDGNDRLVLKREPTGSQYDERQGMLSNLRIPGNLMDGNTNMEDLFANGEMVEVNVEKQKLAEFQFKTLFVGLTIDGKNYPKLADALGAYRKLDRDSKAVIDERVDSLWRAHDEAVQSVAKDEGESVALPSASSEGSAPLSVVSSDTPTQS